MTLAEAMRDKALPREVAVCLIVVGLACIGIWVWDQWHD